MPEWLKNAVFYEIYPQSFYDTDGDGVGDLEGIIRKLDYVQQLGCNALWLNPCFDSPFNDAGYDVRNYYEIAPRYGTNDGMRRLFREAHKKGMRVLLDLVPGHTSIDHEWFKRSMMGDKEFAGRYIWTDELLERFEGVSGISGVISGFCRRGSCAANFFSTQPALNYGFANPDPKKRWQIPTDSPDALATRAAIIDAMRFWLDAGCDGFRIDMAGSLVKGDDNQHANMELWREVRSFLDSDFPEAVIVSEWGDPKHALSAGFHMDFLLHFGPTEYMSLFRDDPYFSCGGRGDLANFVANYTEMLRSAGSNGLICIPSGNHDMPRIAHRLNETELRLAFAFLMSMPGVPFIYYGDEIGMRYLENVTSVEGGYERTGTRSPMQWNSTANAGFSSAMPENLYIPIDPSADRPTVESQMADNGSLWHEVRQLIALRQENIALQSESALEFLNCGENGYPLVYTRGTGSESIKVVLNPSSATVRLEIDNPEIMSIIYGIGRAGRIDGQALLLSPCSGVFLKYKAP